jgi:isopenicillin N synthase-like dioxygenase
MKKLTFSKITSNNLSLINKNTKFNLLFNSSSTSSKYFSQQRVVKIPYEELIKGNKNKLFQNIEDGYGKDGLGIIIIENVPGHLERREKLLKLIYEIVNLPESVLKSLERPEIAFSLGWSYGKEYLNDKPDLLKASYYARLLQVSSKNPEDINVWPKEIPELRQAFFECGNVIRDNGMILLEVIDSYIKEVFPKYNVNYKQVIQESKMNTGRMLYYYPTKMGKGKDMAENNWCEWHNDHGSLTGLCSAMYVDEKGREQNLKLNKTGLYIQDRKGEVIRTTFGKQDIAYQVGETLQIHSGGILHATPHAVKVLDDTPEDIARITFAMFMEPNMDFKIIPPEGSKIENIITSDIYHVPKLQDRFKDGMTFGEFCDATYKKFYK